MERQAGLGRSLEDVLEAVPPIAPTDPAPTDALFGIAPDDLPAPVANGLPVEPSDSKKKKKKSKKSDGDKNKKKNKKKKNKKGKNKKGKNKKGKGKGKKSGQQGK